MKGREVPGLVGAWVSLSAWREARDGLILGSDTRGFLCLKAGAGAAEQKALGLGDLGGGHCSHLGTQPGPVGAVG